MIIIDITVITLYLMQLEGPKGGEQNFLGHIHSKGLPMPLDFWPTAYLHFQPPYRLFTTETNVGPPSAARARLAQFPASRHDSVYRGTRPREGSKKGGRGEGEEGGWSGAGASISSRGRDAS